MVSKQNVICRKGIDTILISLDRNYLKIMDLKEDV